MIYYCIISGILNALTSIVLGLAVLARRRRNGPNEYFVLFVVSGGLWSASYAGWLLVPSVSSALLWTKLLSVAAILIPATYFHFVTRLLDERHPVLVPLGYTLSLCFTALSATPLIVREVAPYGGFPYWPRAGAAYPLYLAFFFSYPTLCWIKLLRAMHRSAHARRNQIKLVLVGTTLGFLGGATNFPYWYEIPIPPAGNGLIVVYLVAVTYAVIGLRLLEVNYVIIKAAVYFVVALVLAAVYPLVFWGLRFITGDDPAPVLIWVLTSIPLATLALVLLPLLRRKVDQVLEVTVLKPFVTVRDQLATLAREVPGIRTERELFDQTARTAAEVLGTFAAFYVRDELDATFRLQTASHVPAGFTLPENIAADHPLLRILRQNRHPLLVDEISALEGFGRADALATKEKFRFEAVVPLHADGVLFGLLGLGPRGKNRVYSDIHLSLLDSVCLQIGLHVRARQIERRANQAEKLISLGTLAAGLAHELRNPLVSIKTFSQLLEESADDPEFRREFSATVLRDVSRIESIVENVAAFATDKKVQHSWIRIEEVVKAAHEIAAPTFHAAQVRCEFQFGETPLVRGNLNQLTQVVLNLMNNAVQAFKGTIDPCVTVSTRHRVDDPANPTIELVVADNGPGIDPEILPRLFEPFTTTKDTGDRERKAGMGLGLAIVRRIVEGHHGVIRVDTEPGNGTRFIIVLPCEAGTETS